MTQAFQFNSFQSNAFQTNGGVKLESITTTEAGSISLTTVESSGSVSTEGG